MDDIIIYELKNPSIPEEWDYNGSVKRMKRLVLNWKTISVEILSELYIAKNKLSCQGVRNDLDPNGLKCTSSN